MAKNDQISFHSQQQTDTCGEWAKQICSRATNTGLTVSRLAKEVLPELDQDDARLTVRKWLAGNALPSDAEHDKLLTAINLPTSEALEQAIEKEVNKLPRKQQKTADRQSLIPSLPLPMRLTHLVLKDYHDAKKELRGQAHLRPFDPFAGQKIQRSSAHSTEPLGELEIWLEDRSKAELKNFLENAHTEERSVKDYFTGLRYFLSRECNPEGALFSKNKLSNLMGFDSSSVNNWTYLEHLPRRESFEKLQRFIENEVSPEAAYSFTEVYITQALQRYEGKTIFAELPKEFWQAKAALTNDPECFSHRDDWRNTNLRPCKDVGGYLEAIRRARGERAQDYINRHQLGVSIEKFRTFENQNLASESLSNKFLQAIRKDEAQFAAENGDALFCEETLQRLTQPSINVEMPDTKAIPSEHSKGLIPAINLKEEYTALSGAFLDMKDASYFKVIGLPSSQEQMAKMDDLSIGDAVQKAVSYFWISDNQQSNRFEEALKDLRDRAAGKDTGKSRE